MDIIDYLLIQPNQSAHIDSLWMLFGYGLIYSLSVGIVKQSDETIYINIQ